VVERLLRRLEDVGPHLRPDAGVVDQQVEPAEGVVDVGDQPLPVGRHRDVGLRHVAAHPEFGQGGADLSGRVRVTHVVDHDVVAGAAQRQRHPASDAPRRPGDQRDRPRRDSAFPACHLAAAHREPPKNV
jgi:hypothetical protein